MPGVLKLTDGTASATRIGIELVDMRSGSEKEVRFGQTLPLGRTATGSNAFTLSLRARYVQTQAGREAPATQPARRRSPSSTTVVG
ncbi:MAG: hypothetical protein ABN502_00625 [Gammaproteobacteria bacterium]